MNTAALSIGLPKWPEMIVVGDTVTPEQAKQVILATDNSLTDMYGAGNNRDFTKFYHNESLTNLYTHLEWSGFTSEMLDVLGFTPIEPSKSIYEVLGTIPLDYIGNDLAMSSYIGGPSGWMNVDGTIYSTKNIGKWPSVQDVFEEWKMVAKAFPFLNLTATLMSDESGFENYPLVQFIVSNGTVSIQTENIIVPSTKSKELDLTTLFQDQPSTIMGIKIQRKQEIGIPVEWFEEVFLSTKQKITQELQNCGLSDEQIAQLKGMVN